jgi:hypothetical protein
MTLQNLRNLVGPGKLKEEAPHGMATLVPCPDRLPQDIVALIEQFGRAWAGSPLRPRPSPAVMAQWSVLLEAWVEDEGLPLFVRKHSGNRGSVILHASGRALVPCDNSPAQWAFVMATAGECPTLPDIKSMFAEDAIPVAMIQKAAERASAKQRCTLSRQFSVNHHGWKLAHIQQIGLNERTAISEVPMERLVSHFRALISPSNMFVVPLAWAGIAEIEAVCRAVAVST